MIIGSFSESADGTLVGHIRTAFFKSNEVVFEPIAEGKSAKAPAFRVLTRDQIELGAAWRRASNETGAVYYDVKIDDPTLSEPIWGRLVQAKSNSGYVLVWERTTARKTAA